MSDNYKIPVSPKHRVLLHELAHSKGRTIKAGSEGRSYRRFMRAFGISVIRETAIENQGRLAGKLANSDERSIFTVSEESLDYALSLQEVPRSPDQDFALGDLWDCMEDARAKKAVNLEGLKDWNPGEEDWIPPQKPVKIEEALMLLMDCRDLLATDTGGGRAKDIHDDIVDVLAREGFGKQMVVSTEPEIADNPIGREVSV